MDSHTFGNSQSAINLMTILEKPENGRHSHQAARILDKYLKSVKAIMFIPDDAVRSAVLLAWRHRFLDWTIKSNFPDLVRTHLSCSIVTEDRKRRLGNQKEDRKEQRNESI